MSALLNYKYKKIGKWLIWIGVITSVITGMYDGMKGDCCDPNSISTYDYGWMIMSLGIILYIISKDKINDEYLNQLKIRAGGIVIILTIIIAAILDFIEPDYKPILGKVIFFQFVAYYLIYKSLSIVSDEDEE